MATENNLKELYVDELGDLLSANDQMQRIMQTMSDTASEARLKDLLQRSITGIGQHSGSIRSILESHGGGKDHCKGMEGLVEEAKNHALNANLIPQLRDLAIIAQYQRMSHYGIAGFGTAAAYATALGLMDEAAKLKAIVSDIYKADEYTSALAEQAEKAAASQPQ